MQNKSIKVLAIDDNPDNLLIIKALIYEVFPHFEIYTSTSGKEGLSMAALLDPDVILLDVVMPDMDGFEVCKVLKADKTMNNIPVVFVTALKGDKHSRIRALEVGGDAFLAKPVDESELIAQVRAMIKIKAANIARLNENSQLAALVAERTDELKKTHKATLNLLEDLKQEIESRKKTEEALHKSEELYRSVINASPDNITVTDLGGNVLMISPKGLELIGYDSDKELRGKSINDFLIPEHRERARNNIVGMFQGVYRGSEEYTLLKQTGGTIDTEINAEFVRGVNGEPTGLVFAIRDITERKQAQDAIRESERKYRLLTEKISDVVWTMDLTGKSQFVSKSIENFTGYTVEEYLNQTFIDRFSPESAEIVQHTLQTEGYKYTHLETIPLDYKKTLYIEYRCKDGGTKVGEVLITPYFDDSNNLIGVHGVTRDITERRYAEEALRASEEKYRLLVENSPNGIAIYQEGKFVYVNKTALQIFGTENEFDILGKPVLSIVHPDSLDAVLERISRVASGDKVPPLEEKVMRFDGSTFDAEVTALSTTFNGRPAGQVLVSDVTDRKLAARKLSESEEKFRDTANLLPQVIFELDLSGTILYINEHAHSVFGYEYDELIGLNSLLVHVPEERERVMDGVRKKIVGEVIDNKEFKMLRKDGTVFPALIYINIIIKDEIPIGVRGVVIDITEQKEAEEKIRVSQSKYYELYTLMRLMSDTMPDMLWAKDLDGNYTFANKAMCERLLCAVDTEEPFGKPDIFFAKRERDLHTDNPQWHTFGEVCNDTDITTIREMREMQFDEYGMVQGKFLYLDVHKAPLFNEQNELIGVVGTARDITERKLAEDKLKYVTRLYALLSHINQAIIQIKDADELLEAVCELAIQYGQFRMCWIGVYDENKNLVIPHISAGYVDGYLDNLSISPGDEKTGRGPTGLALQEGRQVYCNDVANDPIMRIWRDEALKRGYRSSFSSPLYRKKKRFGALTIYGTEINFFNEEEQHLLSEISENITYALDAIDSELDRKLAEVALVESESKYRELMDNSPEGITIYVEGKVAYINKEALRLMRAKDKSEMMGKTIVDFIHPDNQELVLERMKLVAMAPINAILPSVEEKYIRLDGTEVFVEIKVMPILFEGKLAIQLSGHDITDRKEAELALEQSRSELKTIYDHAPVMMCVVNKERKIQFANEAFTSLTGLTEELMRDGAVGGVVGCVNSFDDPNGCGFGSNCKNCGLRIAMEDTYNNATEYQNVEYHSVLTVGSLQKEVYLLGSTSLIQTSNQRQVLLCLHDITDRKFAEEALHKSEMLLRTFIDNTPFEIWARDIDSVGILENKKLTDHYGSIVGFTPKNDPRIDVDTLMMWEKNNDRVFAGEVIDEEYEFMVNDEMRIYQQIVFPIKINNKIIGIAGFNIDITDRKIAEEKIHENSIKLDMAMQVANMSWWEMNLKTGGVIFGKRKTDMMGYSQEGFTHYRHFTDLVHPEDHDKAMESMRNHIIGTGDKYEIEYRILTAGGDYKWFYDIGSISKRDMSGNPVIVSGLVLDITERKQAEVLIKESQQQLKKFAAHLQNVREEERVLLAREIHDQLGQILVAVKIDMGMLKLNVLKHIDRHKSEELLGKFDDLSTLIDNTIKTARKIMTDLRPEVLDMLGFIETVNQHLNSFQERHKMQCKFESHISNLNLTSQQSVALFRIIQEALNNVAKHSKANKVKVNVNQKNGRLALEVVDNGVGFDTNNKKKSDSYGLIGMKERVFLLEGELSITSKVGEGTIVRVEMPYVNN
jgi:PAS domain S-box-containing protein